MHTLDSLKAGAVAGLVAGGLTAAFGYLLAEPVMDRAVDLEAAKQRAAGDMVEETFTRAQQHIGFGVAALVVGLALGVLYAVAYRYAKHLSPHTDPWRRALYTGGAAFFALVLVPFVRYPGNPPGANDPATIGLRTDVWLLCLLLGVLGAVGAVMTARHLRAAEPACRQLAIAGVLAGTIALSFALPASPDLIATPADLVWTFRLLSLGSLVVLYGALSTVFGLLAQRRSRLPV